MTRRKGGAKQGVVENYDRILSGTFAIIYTRAVSAARLGAFQTLIQADPDNTNSVFVGGAAQQPIELPKGESITIPTDPSLIYVTGNGERVNWIAVR